MFSQTKRKRDLSEVEIQFQLLEATLGITVVPPHRQNPIRLYHISVQGSNRSLRPDIYRVTD